MNDNEKLIEEARKYVSDHDAYADNHLLRDLADALEAAEKAHTPTGDYEAGYAEGFHHGLSTPRGAAEDDRACAQCGGQECPRGKCEWDAFLSHRTQGAPSDARAERARIIADLREWSRPLGNSPEEETLRLVIDRIERAAGVSDG